jgi:hypothetical protein
MIMQQELVFNQRWEGLWKKKETWLSARSTLQPEATCQST